MVKITNHGKKLWISRYKNYLCEPRCELAVNDTILVFLSISGNLPEILAIFTAASL